MWDMEEIQMAKKVAVKEVTLETTLWNCRVALRGIGSTEKNRDAVIGLVFLKFAGDKFEKRRAELVEQYGEIPAFLEKVSFYNAVNVFYCLYNGVKTLALRRNL